ncbi:LLM class flavin-dependent oxidoreductase [Aerobium aerolatum]|uniref:Flavin-dependent oxidoreductase, luciferase family (Includes alkanesulfonate monooxygenase SsuD and methylene tetrahydromethanopterin reductase) n=1 Tax=Aquamicrobium aerolatum DSM 21857 TaxID=1121003 RepID=A0A1I3P184_9HYPH|nr:LLM class flavin-dependent oxidoreductase [Aquamicrobium aerolatum]SFJ15209.1 Flavin-dependent oxidoreductase, luciferase family (includes alkanesulfonate monooxygenase SsuD and methylene tetrahydromethanopterin reductase) [Aquamicrobium aerolatum DSM 21857]
MKLGYFTMPMHPAERAWVDTLREDREAVILADQLGFHDAFIGEHLSDVHENITSSMLFLASLVSDTKSIKLATGTSNLSQSHPVLIAAHAAMLDHMSNGRLILGISPGALTTDAEALGILDEDRNKMFEEAIDVILAIWERDAPYDIDFPDNRYKVSTARTAAMELGVGQLPKPLQQPRPEIVGTVLAPYSKGVIAMGKRDFHPLSANFLLPKWVKTHWPNYVEGKESVGQKADTADWRVARTIFVADDENTARSYGRDDANSPYRFYYEQIRKKLIRSQRLFVFKSEREQSDESVTYDYMMDNLMIHGTVNSVVDQILALREEVGDFGEIVYAGLDWADADLAKRSMQLMAEEVMPRVNAAISA